MFLMIMLQFFLVIAVFFSCYSHETDCFIVKHPSQMQQDVLKCLY